jgi:hypothetical protein
VHERERGLECASLREWNFLVWPGRAYTIHTLPSPAISVVIVVGETSEDTAAGFTLVIYLVLFSSPTFPSHTTKRCTVKWLDTTSRTPSEITLGVLCYELRLISPHLMTADLDPCGNIQIFFLT